MKLHRPAYTRFLVFLFLLPVSLFGQYSLLQSGPMLGYSEMKEVLLWVQTTKAAKVKFRYWVKGTTDKKHETKEELSKKENAFVVKLIADEVEPDNTYMYELLLNGKSLARPYPLEFQTQKLWRSRTDPPAFTIALGSCTYVNDSVYDRPGKPYGGNYEIFTSIYKKDPDAMLWMGDNIYLREADWNTRTGILYRNTQTRSLPELQPLLGSVHNYAIWDDHDYGPNDSDRSFFKKDDTFEAFKLFWGNPTYGVMDEKCITTTFEWGDAHFFLLDDRWFRSPNKRVTGDREILGKKQLEWLIDALRTSNSTFKIVAMGGQVVSPLQVYENYATYGAEQNYLIETIGKEKIEGVLFVSGDRHHTELTKKDREGTYPLYDLTVSPLTSSASNFKEENPLRVPGTLVNERNFATLEFSGPRTDQQVKMSVFNVNGNLIWERTIKAGELKLPK